MSETEKPAILKRLDELFTQGELRPEADSGLDEATAYAIKRHTERMMHEAFCGALRLANHPDGHAIAGPMFYEWLRFWQREQEARHVENLRAVAGWQNMTLAEWKPDE